MNNGVKINISKKSYKHKSNKMPKAINNSPKKLIKKNIRSHSNRKIFNRKLNSNNIKTNFKPVKPNLNIVCILDKFSYECFKYECKLMQLSPNSWKKNLETKKPDLLFVESAWNGINGEWNYRIFDLQKSNDGLLKKIIDYCNKNNIPTVFWNKEDPINFDRFIEAAKLFDYIFTTDSDCIPKYQSIVKHDNIFLLPFAAQPKLHNPMNLYKYKKKNVAFAGSWYNRNAGNRKNDTRIILRPAFNYGLDIYDRNYGTKNTFFKFPHEYQPYIKQRLSYKKILLIYKKYKVFLNVNSVNQSPTMFSRRIFELLACGTPIISSYSIGIKKLFNNIVKLSRSESETEKHLKVLLNNSTLRNKLSVLGIREVLSKHTYTHRINTIIQKTKLNHDTTNSPGISIITCTKRPNNIDNILFNYNRQNYEKKELILILNNNSIDLQSYIEYSNKYKNIRIFQLDENISLGECLNYGVKQSIYNYVSKFDDDDYYSNNFLTDSMNAFKYTDASIIGKRTYFAYLKNNKKFVIRHPNQEYQYVNIVSGATMVIDKKVFNKVNFKHVSVGEDSFFLKDCIKNNYRIFSIDKYNYTCIRNKNKSDHTWKASDSEFLENCKIINSNCDYKTLSTL